MRSSVCTLPRFSWHKAKLISYTRRTQLCRKCHDAPVANTNPGSVEDEVWCYFSNWFCRKSYVNPRRETAQFSLVCGVLCVRALLLEPLLFFWNHKPTLVRYTYSFECLPNCGQAGFKMRTTVPIAVALQRWFTRKRGQFNWCDCDFPLVKVSLQLFLLIPFTLFPGLVTRKQHHS